MPSHKLAINRWFQYEPNSSVEPAMARKGIASMPRTPHLAGQDQEYLLEQLRNYRSGKRHHEVMSAIAKSLGDSDLESITNWFSSQRIVIEKHLSTL
jgi:cytochrome c553